MIIKKNKKGTFDLTEVSLGKLQAIVNAINNVECELSITPVQSDVRDIIKEAIK